MPDRFTRAPAIATSRLRMVRAVRMGPSMAMIPAQRLRLCARTAQASQAPLAAKRPEGQCSSPLSLSSRMASSTTAWLRWNRSASVVVRVLLQMNAWWRQVGHIAAWAVSASRVRRTTSRTVRARLPVPVV